MLSVQLAITIPVLKYVVVKAEDKKSSERLSTAEGSS